MRAACESPVGDINLVASRPSADLFFKFIQNHCGARKWPESLKPSGFVVFALPSLVFRRAAILDVTIHVLGAVDGLLFQNLAAIRVVVITLLGVNLFALRSQTFLVVLALRGFLLCFR